ncbi:MAG: hypothetical protein DMD44_14535 [Gemmatimonadetes bacterium]|nr:MAG: hypothetical protein DMD44_14535 [Gemmatimonadota bacterium]
MSPVLLVALGLVYQQGAQPLRKAELVRLLATKARSKTEVAALVRRSCVTFHPSERDRADLRAAGADDAVLAAIDQCLRAHAAARPSAPPTAAPPAAAARAPAAAPPPARAPTQPLVAPLRVVVSQQIAAPAGGAADVAVQLYRGTDPQPGVELLLRGASVIPGGATQDPVAITDWRGIATFRVLAGTAPGTYRLTVAMPNGPPLGPTTRIDFITTPIFVPPPPPKPVVSEGLTRFTQGTELHGTAGAALAVPLVLEVRDTTGAPFVGELVTFTATGGAVDPGVATTDRSGTLRVRVTLGERAGPVVVTAKVGPLSRTATVYADPGLARELVLERGSAPLAGQLSLASRDTVVLRVSARDAHGNRTALEEFAATTTGRAIELRSTVMADSAAVVTLAPRRSGTGELELSGSGVRTRVSVTVALIGVQGGAWAIGARSAWLGSNDPWIALPNLTGMSGADWSVFGRRTLVGGLSLALGGAGGSLSAERTTGNVSLTLVEGYGRAELALAPRGAVSPVLALGGGVYRLKSADGGQTVFHTSTFWSGGGGLDVAVSPSVTLELRVERHWMWDTDLGHVATLWPLAAGVRAGL